MVRKTRRARGKQPGLREAWGIAAAEAWGIDAVPKRDFCAVGVGNRPASPVILRGQSCFQLVPVVLIDF